MTARDPEPHQASAGTHPEPTHPGDAHPPSKVKAGGEGWFSRRRAEKERRKVIQGRQRIVHRVEMLGPLWQIVDYHPDDPDFLAIGPGGVFQVTVADHGRSKVELAGDVVQVDGQRPPYVALARRDASRISQQMSKIAGRRIPVIPVVAFLGNGPIVYYGRPPEGCVVTSYRDVGQALNAHGNRINQQTIAKLALLAARVDSATVGQYLRI